VVVEGGQHQHGEVVAFGPQPPQRLDPVHAGHAQVQQDHIRVQLLHGPENLVPVGGVGDDADVGRQCQQALDPLADECLVVRDQYLDHGASARTAAWDSGNITLTIKPLLPLTSTVPPSASTRSVRPVSPCPKVTALAPMPSSRAVKLTASGWRERVSHRLGASECRIVFVTNSWTQRTSAADNCSSSPGSSSRFGSISRCTLGSGTSAVIDSICARTEDRRERSSPTTPRTSVSRSPASAR